MDLSEYTHYYATYEDFKYLTDFQEKDIVTYYDDNWSKKISVFGFYSPETLTESAGNYLYFNLFENLERYLNISLIIIVNVQEALTWCEANGY